MAPYRAGFRPVSGFRHLLVARPDLPEAIEIQRVVSPGGIEAWLVEDHKNPIIPLCQFCRWRSRRSKARKGWPF